MRGRQKHQNIVIQIKHTTPRDNHNEETRYTKTKHDDRTNSLEPTENVTPVSYTASPRPKMLYNGSQTYNPDQYDPFYAVYDEDGELYKDTDYVQQYNTASLRPAVQQTYRGTPPPARRPVETYTPRPVPVDYDDALIQGQISNQNQYQSPIRHSTRGDGNELGYEHNPSSVKTTYYEATTISTTPSTTTSTSTTTTTQRTTPALLTEAMTPSRYTARSSTDENPNQNPEKSSNNDPSDGSSDSFPVSPSPLINLSSLAKPFERTDNSHRLSETLLLKDKSLTSRHSSRFTNNKPSLDVVQPSSKENKKVVSLTTGFSIRRNLNNTNNPYTLTVLTRPFDDYNKTRGGSVIENNKSEQGRYYYYDTEDNMESVNIKSSTPKSNSENSLEVITQRKDLIVELQRDEDIPKPVRPKIRIPSSKTRYVISTEPTTVTTTATTKYYLKSVVRRPFPYSGNGEQYLDSTENSIHPEVVRNSSEDSKKSDIELVSQANISSIKEKTLWEQIEKSEEILDDPVVSPYKSLDNLRNQLSNRDNLIQESTTSSTSTTPVYSQPETEKPRSKTSYYSYRIVDEVVPDQTTEVFSGKVKNVIRAFFSNLASTPTPRLLEEFSITTHKNTPQPEEKVVNIGFQKKKIKYVDDKPLRTNTKRIQIVTEPSVNSFLSSDGNIPSLTENIHDLSSTTMSTVSPVPLIITEPTETQVLIDSSTNKNYRTFSDRQSFESKFNIITTTKPEVQTSHKFQKLLHNPSSERNNYDSVTYKNIDDTITKSLSIDTTKSPSEIDWDEPSNQVLSEVASTTSTTKATSTVRNEPTSSTKSISFPTRASRVNPAIKLAAKNLGGGRRSYQTSSKCSSDNSLQANPKCNEIKYQRPSSTRGRGSAHYSTASDAPQPVPNRGTPPTRNRPTLKPSTAIVSKSTEFVDIYAHPPSRPAPVYPQPTPDKTAAKCRKDVCLLPDCYCGGRDIPGNLQVSEVPQIVLITFDDAVNDLNKMYYEELFERGRVNPNGCPISATFYVSHEWTDYSQVQNLYADGHEFASHTVSHSFGEQFTQKKWNREVGGQREILAAYGGVKLEDVRGMRAPFLSVGGNKMFKMLYDSNFTYDSSLPVYENRPPSWPYTLDYKLFHDCMIPPCPTKSYPGVWEVPMVMWQDLNGGRCSMGDACANPPEAEGVYKMILKNFDRHYTTNRAPFGLYYHAAWFTQPHHKAGFIMFLDFINQMQDVWIITNWQALQWVRDPTPISRLNNFQPFQCNYQDRPKKCNNPKVCNLWHKSGVRYMRTCQPCPEQYPWTGKTGIKSSRIDNEAGE
ncbi:unnamed protein product [Chilo suppressalis]|uniref:NodB homology domain-containing protein n=1 Tax=Chilo suppressalis TaxID=168631 RepID=A0ABN8L700_CHISP|nr:unnamed protein product [Chilo suppressalis]